MGQVKLEINNVLKHSLSKRMEAMSVYLHNCGIQLLQHQCNNLQA